MYFPRDGPWAEPDFRGGQFFSADTPHSRAVADTAARKHPGPGPDMPPRRPNPPR